MIIVIRIFSKLIAPRKQSVSVDQDGLFRNTIKCSPDYDNNQKKSLGQLEICLTDNACSY